MEYQNQHHDVWNQFVSHSKNGVFLFMRDYMEYHSNRFADLSIMFRHNNLLALMPANILNDVVYSHGGLTFGGVVSDEHMKTSTMLEIFDAMKAYLRGQRVRRIVYKPVPHIYQSMPAQEDLYALFVHNAQLVRRDVSSAIFMSEKKPFQKKRRWSIKKSRQYGIEVKRSYDFRTFMGIEHAVLKEKYGTVPTHTADEIDLLANRFPDNIQLFAAHKGDAMVAGVIIYNSKNVAHAQYIAATDMGKKMYAVDMILDYLISEYCSDKKYFDFGISTTKEGRALNAGLIAQKEEFGARAVVYDTYEIPVN